MSFWDGKRVLVTGGAGFIGSHVVEELLRRSRGARVTVADNFSHGRRINLSAVAKDVKLVSADFLLLDDCLKVCRGQDIVLNVAAHVAGVGYNAVHQATMFRDNMQLSINMMEAARRSKVERLLVVSSACVYPREAPVPTPETEGFVGAPEPTNEGYGWSKRMAEYLGRAYHQEFGMRVAIVRPYNAYGPRDRYNSADSHVVAALISRIVGGENPVRVWGGGLVSRAFLFVEDAARGMLDVAARYAECDPVNLGTSEEITMGDLARTIQRLAGSRARLLFDASKPAGAPRRNCDTTKAREKAGFVAQVSLEEGLRRSIEWYRRRFRAKIKRGA